MPLIDPNKPYFSPLEGSAHMSVTLDAGVFTYNAPLNGGSVAVQAVTENVRFTMDGSAPTATRGFQIVAGNPAQLIQLTKTATLRFIRETSGAVLELQAGG